ncbi:hypothetical protein NDU88_008078 [Pleurodeles waltl]|uniref:Uncharacterized protein n=1 Tax=Pleurodeles waltl TaxID=8319 RepID=A0AAV7NWP9_PLEWA|nr:hypothetical protein NDU88_008078 [Pleurodeles waltl]
MVAPGKPCWVTAAGVFRELHAALWFLPHRGHVWESVGRDSTSCDARGSKTAINREKMETKLAAVRDSRQCYTFMETDGWQSDGELGQGSSVGLGSQCIRHAAHKQQGMEIIDKTGLLQGDVSRYTLRSHNSQWAVGKDDAELDQGKVKASARQVKSRDTIPSAKAPHFRKSSAKIVAAAPPNEK